jgi:Kef-type K+ transport system membrane component KefB
MARSRFASTTCEVGTELSIPTFFGVLALLVVVAHLGGFVAQKLKLPSVVGELGAGIALAAIPSGVLRSLRGDVLPNACAELGVLLLLFDIGLELRTADFRRIGGRALAVALLGVTGTVAFVGAASVGLHAASSIEGHVFIAATLAATSIGIAGRVLREFGRTQSAEGKLVLAAAVLDDVLGLVLLAFVTAWIGSKTGDASAPRPNPILLAGKALGFLALAVAFGRLALPRLFALLARVAGESALLVFGLGVCLAYAWAANLAGLAPAIGAFTAGLVIQPEDYEPLVQTPGDTLEGLVAPLLAFFVPIFFLLAGLKVDVAAFADRSVWLLALALVVASSAGKLCAGLGAGGSTSRFVVGLSLIPRGEVSLIFATTGAALGDPARPLLSPTAFNAIVVTVIATALLPPIALRRAFARKDRHAHVDRRKMSGS